MRSLTTITFFFLLLFTASHLNSTQAGLNTYSLLCLEIEGKISNAGAGKDAECLIELFSNAEVIDSLVLREGKRKFKFTLPRNAYYTIRVSKKGYVPKLVCINTKMPKGNDKIFAFTFETALLDEAASKSLNQSVLDFPIAIIYYDTQLEGFSYNKDYSETIKRQLNTPYTSLADMDVK